MQPDKTGWACWYCGTAERTTIPAEDGGAIVACGACGSPQAMCTQMWRDDGDELQFCGLERGHSSECTTAEGWRHSETVEMI